uniref:Uncharacterized protein n=1 Tax=Rhizophagus irregularis (strain DAOM 181602 / DAOM 197198 / MUCL 43194) TaxID=747089 RepID=U9TJW0_RHIID
MPYALPALYASERETKREEAKKPKKIISNYPIFHIFLSSNDAAKRSSIDYHNEGRAKSIVGWSRIDIKFDD